MKPYFLYKLLLLSLFNLCGQALSAQFQVYKQLQDLRREQGIIHQSGQLFARPNAGFRSSAVEKAVQKSTLLKLNSSELKDLHQSAHSLLDISLPYENGTLQLELFKTELFAPDFSAVSSESDGQAVPVKTGVFYRGIVKGNPQSLATISLFEDEVIGVVSFDRGNLVIGHYNQIRPDDYVVYNDIYLNNLVAPPAPLVKLVVCTPKLSIALH